MKKGRRSYLSKWVMMVFVFLLIGMFLTGVGLQRYIMNQEIRNKPEMAEGMEAEEARDLRNRQLVNSMNYVSIEREIYFDRSDTLGEARISNDKESNFGCTVTLIRDATGEEIYHSDIIEPGYYIESIYLNSSLEKGYHPCTVIWSFYTEIDEYVGETARKTAVVIKH